MQKNNLLELLNKLSQAVVGLKQSQNNTTTPQKTLSKEPENVINVEKINRQKPTPPKTDAIIKMLRAHNEMSRRIIEENKK